MCLYTEQEEPIKLTEDLKVYKWVGKILPDSNNKLKIYSIFRKKYFGYYNEVQQSDLKFIKTYGFINNFIIYEVSKGYHSATSIKSLKEYMLIYRDYNLVLNIIECTIPAGSLIYYNETGLVVSNQIIYDEIVEKVKIK
jgi:hypothetical protein